MSENKMSRSERSELGQIIRKREKVMKVNVEQRSAEMLAEFEKQIATIYSFDSDAVWKEAAETSKQFVIDANDKIKKRCEELGIPAEFAPGLSFGWYGRGQNAVNERRSNFGAWPRPVLPRWKRKRRRRLNT
jgi:hypothetical protein